MANQLSKDFLSLFKSGSFADVEIICKGRVFKAHRAILSARSPYFEAALNGDWEEASTGKICVDEMDPHTISLMLKYTYTGDLNVLFPNTDRRHLCLEACVQLWIHADYFQLAQLKMDIFEHFINMATENVCNLWTFVLNSHGSPQFVGPPYYWILCDGNKDKFVADLDSAIRVAYASPAARLLQRNLCAFSMTLRGKLPKEVLVDLTTDLPDFNNDLTTSLLGLHFGHTDQDAGEPDPTSRRGLNAQHLPMAGNWCAWCGTCNLYNGGPIMVDPITEGKARWCSECRSQALLHQVSVLVHQLPA